jgi:hypothetical protein
MKSSRLLARPTIARAGGVRECRQCRFVIPSTRLGCKGFRLKATQNKSPIIPEDFDWSTACHIAGCAFEVRFKWSCVLLLQTTW